jgi:phosphoribosylformylglycinamidine synthase
LQAVGVSVGKISAEFSHFIATMRPIEPAERATLDRLLVYGEPSSTSSAIALIVIPREGTVSPWSSKATDIAKNCGLDMVVRIERGVAYAIEGYDELSIDKQRLIWAVVHDPMTEAIRAGRRMQRWGSRCRLMKSITSTVITRGRAGIQLTSS